MPLSKSFMTVTWRPRHLACGITTDKPGTATSKQFPVARLDPNNVEHNNDGTVSMPHLRLGLEWEEPLHQCTGCGVELEVGAVDPDGGLWSSLPLCRHNSMWQMSPPDRLDCHSSASRSPKGVARLGSCFERFQYLRRRKNAYLAMSVRRKQVLPTVPRNSIGRKGYAARELLP
jgi:hypothetical protein